MEMRSGPVTAPAAADSARGHGAGGVETCRANCETAARAELRGHQRATARAGDGGIRAVAGPRRRVVYVFGGVGAAAIDLVVDRRRRLHRAGHHDHHRLELQRAR